MLLRVCVHYAALAGGVPIAILSSSQPFQPWRQLLNNATTGAVRPEKAGAVRFRSWATATDAELLFPKERVVLNWFYLAGAIGCEIVATSALKAADGFTRPGPTLIVVLGYVSAFYCLSVALRSIPMGIAYAIWSGIGIVVISLVGLFAYRQKLDSAALVGIALIIAGTLVINLLSKAGHP